LIFASSCYYDEVLPQEANLPDPDVELSYALDIQPIWDESCVSCHAGSIPPNLAASVSYDALISGNYINTSNPESSSLYTKIEIGGSMETYANASERAIILTWIEQGALDN
ncbi:MAG: hypothetical protein GY816_05670, partial [Cytophagales bacterium]|nr:hypothetical protein [Cytophagales bacterium]